MPLQLHHAEESALRRTSARPRLAKMRSRRQCCLESKIPSSREGKWPGEIEACCPRFAQNRESASRTCCDDASRQEMCCARRPHPLPDGSRSSPADTSYNPSAIHGNVNRIVGKHGGSTPGLVSGRRRADVGQRINRYRAAKRHLGMIQVPLWHGPRKPFWSGATPVREEFSDRLERASNQRRASIQHKGKGQTRIELASDAHRTQTPG